MELFALKCYHQRVLIQQYCQTFINCSSYLGQNDLLLCSYQWPQVLRSQLFYFFLPSLYLALLYAERVLLNQLQVNHLREKHPSAILMVFVNPEQMARPHCTSPHVSTTYCSPFPEMKSALNQRMKIVVVHYWEEDYFQGILHEQNCSTIPYMRKQTRILSNTSTCIFFAMVYSRSQSCFISRAKSAKQIYHTHPHLMHVIIITIGTLHYTTLYNIPMLC